MAMHAKSPRRSPRSTPRRKRSASPPALSATWKFKINGLTRAANPWDALTMQRILQQLNQQAAKFGTGVIAHDNQFFTYATFGVPIPKPQSFDFKGPDNNSPVSVGYFTAA
jgi:hypothetical protein